MNQFSVNDYPLASMWPYTASLDDVVARIDEQESEIGKCRECGGDIRAALLQRAQVLFNENSDQIRRHHVDELLDAGLINDEQADGWFREQLRDNDDDE